MKTLTQVRIEFSMGGFHLSDHADERMPQRDINGREIRQAGSQANIIEYYPDDKYSPSCLLLGFTNANRTLHILVSLDDRDYVKVITVYEPDPERWIDHARRR